MFICFAQRIAAFLPRASPKRTLIFHVLVPSLKTCFSGNTSLRRSRHLKEQEVSSSPGFYDLFFQVATRAWVGLFNSNCVTLQCAFIHQLLIIFCFTSGSAKTIPSEVHLKYISLCIVLVHPFPFAISRQPVHQVLFSSLLVFLLPSNLCRKFRFVISSQ